MSAASYLVFRFQIVSFFRNDFLILIGSERLFPKQKRAHDHGMKSNRVLMLIFSQFFRFRLIVEESV